MELNQIQNQLSVMKDQEVSHETQSKVVTKHKHNEVSLFELCGDEMLREDQNEWIKEKVFRFLSKVPVQFKQDMFMQEIYKSGMGQKQFLRHSVLPVAGRWSDENDKV